MAGSPGNELGFERRCERNGQVSGELSQCYAELLRCIDQSPLIMSQEQATRFHDLALEHLQLCALLNKRSRRLVRQQVGRNLFMMLTKHHHLYEAAIEVKRERIHPSSWCLFAGEDFVGRMSRICRVCHRSSLSQRVLERYLALVHLELQSLRKAKA